MVRYATEDYVKEWVNKLQWHKVLDISLEPKTKEYCFNEFDLTKNYQIYVHLNVLTGINKIDCLGQITWLNELPLVELRNSFHTDIVTDAMVLIFNPITKIITIKNRPKIFQDIQQIVIYEKEI